MHLYSIISALMFILVATCEFLYTSKRLIDRVDMLNPPSLFLIEWSPISYYHRQNILWRHFWKINSLLWWIRHSQNLHSQKSTRKHSRHFVLFLFLKTDMRNIASDWVRSRLDKSPTHKKTSFGVCHIELSLTHLGIDKLLTSENIPAQWPDLGFQSSNGNFEIWHCFLLICLHISIFFGSVP